MQLQNVTKLIFAAHHSYLVASPSPERGGVFLVSSQNNLKTTIVSAALANVHGALCYSDLTLKQLAVIRSQISDGVIHTLGFYEFEKLYARNPSVASNLEGVIKAMVAEGFGHFAFEDKRLSVPTARCFVLASVLDTLYRARGSDWLNNGFLRRFLCIKYSLSQKAKTMVMDAIHLGRRVEMPGSMVAPSSAINYDVTNKESHQLQAILKDDYPTISLTLLQKSLCVLKWHNRAHHDRHGPTPMEILQNLDGLGGSDWGIMEIEEAKLVKKRKKKRHAKTETITTETVIAPAVQ
jgi:hypothetical protein